MKYTAKEINQHCTHNDVWICIEGKVYDVTKFLEDHPGGQETLMDNAGGDATSNFQDVGHSEDARELMKKYEIGELEGPPPDKYVKRDPIVQQSSNTQGFGVLAIAAVGFAAYLYFG
ncbi:hypothetical protein BB559_000615 [Furculomyces boomerangus]|uniref:Cytochrome b5 heme-binding domain-containing protein n=2 Tax=Harpellales TaxID=61421 RepID=A0A2T9Z4M7_9FUNG|nr:hypothetical protein BB559_006421 [Furculomyces boomerangus]PVU99557.1 hypothetical protein BB559_000615 [Furculomyces boomerangus]PVZ99592.1 hypothetical protein BB558_004389 [Smittium angustum]